jgi:hypothetical protein
MRTVILCCVMLTHLFAALAVAATPATALKPVVLRQTTFNIPFFVDLSRGTPREVQLFVSQDAGQTWHFYGRQVPTAKNFPFRASGDGDFWFASRTTDAQGNVPPVEQLRPELHVQVDTQQPQFEFAAVIGLAGEITTTWKVTDASLEPSSLKIEYQVGTGNVWRSVAIDSSGNQNEADSLVGKMTFYPDGNSADVNIRAEVVDRAGNKSVVNRRPTPAQPSSQLSDSPNREEPPTNPTSQPSPDAIFKTIAEKQGSATRWPRDNKLASDASPKPANAAAETDRPPLTDVSTTGTTSRYGPGTTAVDVAEDDVEEAANAAIPNNLLSRSGLPPGERARMTNSLRFQLDYELDSVGPEGVDEIQLWGSKDFGQTWIRWSLDEDLRSPLDVEVDREGIYGLRVVIVGRNGLATPAPHTGDLADIWVGVDTTRPAARISSAIYGEGLHAGELDIRWEAIDESLGDRAITLLFGEQPSGPWTTIAAGLPNTKQYFWSVDPNTPRQIYLRLEVRDDAGNMAVHQLVEPISTSGLVPKAFIRSVRPVPSEPQEAFLRNRSYKTR